MKGKNMISYCKTITRQISIAAALVLLAGSVTAGGAKPLPENSDDSAAQAATPAADGNIFTAPDAGNQVPMYAESNSPGDRAKRALLGNKKDGIPTFEQIRTIPSLTQPQRKQLRELFGQAKEQMAPIMEQLKALKEKNGGDVKQAMADPEAREKFLDLRRQVQDLRKQTWEQVRGILSDGQLQELSAMRKGELTPATFNPPITDPRQLLQQRRAQQMQQNGDGGGNMPAREQMPAGEQMPASDN